MRKAEIEKIIGKENWNEFWAWMRGQTCSTYPDGELDIYECDVEAFKKKLDTGYDRQNSEDWD